MNKCSLLLYNAPITLTIYSPEALKINMKHSLILMNSLKQDFPKFCLWGLLMCTRDHDWTIQQNSSTAQYLLSRIATARMGNIKPLSHTSGR